MTMATTVAVVTPGVRTVVPQSVFMVMVEAKEEAQKKAKTVAKVDARKEAKEKDEAKENVKK